MTANRPDRLGDVSATRDSSEVRLRALLAGILDPVVTFDALGTVQDASAAVLSVFGWEPDALIGRKVDVLVAEPQRALHDGHLAGRDEKGATDVLERTREIEVVRRDGTRLVCELSVSRVELPGGRPVFVGTFRDATARRKAEQALAEGERRSSAAFERETNMLKALAAIGESASVLIHEIKNPMTGIHLAIRAVADQLGEDSREILQGLEQSLQKIERTMRRTLSFAKALELRCRPIDPARLLESVERRARTELPPSSAALELECASDLPTVEADERLLEEALLNLLKNALEAGSRVRLGARRARGDLLELTVEDDGSGIPAHVLPNLFKPFYTTKPEGAGIGLAACKKIIDAHGGEISAGRSPLGGAAFTICLPLA